MKKIVIAFILITLLATASTSHAQWIMRVYQDSTIAEFEVSRIDSIIYYEHADNDWAFIPAGTFTMGSPSDEWGRSADEIQHEVTLTNSFYMSITEVTKQQFIVMAQWAYDHGYCTASSTSLQDALDGSTVELLDIDGAGCEISFSGGIFSVNPGSENHPVKEVTWYGAAAYCDWMSLQAGLPRAYDHSTWECNGHAPYNAAGYRLPTEAEWEYACRAETVTPFYTGDCLDAGTEANYNGFYPYIDCPSGPDVFWTVEVGSYTPNPYGLYDMHGNIGEWVNDWLGNFSGDEIDPVGPETGEQRIIRGGNCYNVAYQCRSAARYQDPPDNSYNSTGFRVCHSPFLD